MSRARRSFWLLVLVSVLAAGALSDALAADPSPATGLVVAGTGLGPAARVTIVGVVSQSVRTELLQILAEAEKAQRLNRRYVDEIVSWTARQGNEWIPATSLLRRTPAIAPDIEPSRFPSGTLTDHEPESHPVEPALLAICTSPDDTASRLRAGEALGSILVKGTADGLSMASPESASPGASGTSTDPLKNRPGSSRCFQREGPCCGPFAPSIGPSGPTAADPKAATVASNASGVSGKMEGTSWTAT